jgi:hypothetical protein
MCSGARNLCHPTPIAPTHAEEVKDFPRAPIELINYHAKEHSRRSLPGGGFLVF